MKSTIKIEVLGQSNSVFVTIGDHVIKSYESYGKELWEVIRTAERYAERWINKYWNDGGTIKSYGGKGQLLSTIEIMEK